MTVAAILINALGLGLVLVVLRDVFHQLFHPGGSGHLSDGLMQIVWRAFRTISRDRQERLALAGPTALIVVIVSWVTLMVVGWALIYWPHMPQNFLFSTGLNTALQGDFLDALYLSFVTLVTLGYGDITPTENLLRILAPLQALIGFGLLTASITWVLSIYPALSRSRSLAQEISLLHDAEVAERMNITEMDAGSIESLFHDLSSQLVSVRNDLMQFSITYYFHSSDDRSGIATTLPYLASLAEKANNSNIMEVRVSASMLRGAVEKLAATIAGNFLRLDPSSTEKNLQAFARDHLRRPLSRDAIQTKAEDD
ncbi:hypothetical protein BH23ACT11_BH23ACT11_29170 [soil metagenome]